MREDRRVEAEIGQEGQEGNKGGLHRVYDGRQLIEKSIQESTESCMK